MCGMPCLVRSIVASYAGFRSTAARRLPGGAAQGGAEGRDEGERGQGGEAGAQHALPNAPIRWWLRAGNR